MKRAIAKTTKPAAKKEVAKRWVPKNKPAAAHAGGKPAWQEAGAVGSGGAQWRAEAESGNFEAEYGVQLIDVRELINEWRTSREAS